MSRWREVDLRQARSPGRMECRRWGRAAVPSRRLGVRRGDANQHPRELLCARHRVLNLADQLGPLVRKIWLPSPQNKPPPVNAGGGSTESEITGAYRTRTG